VGKGRLYGPGIWTLEKWSSSNQKKLVSIGTIVLKKKFKEPVKEPTLNCLFFQESHLFF
jgi:hypothetical protein